MTSKDFTYNEKDLAFCRGVIEYGNQVKAYREAFDNYTGSNATIAVKACNFAKSDKISIMIDEMRAELHENNKITLSELVYELANMIRFDPAEMYNENGGMKSLHDMPKPVRQMIAGLDTVELYENLGGDKIPTGQIKKVKLIDKLGAIEKLMKHLGAYKEHNDQKKGTVVQFELPKNNRHKDGNPTEI